MNRRTWLAVLLVFLTGCVTPQAEILSKTGRYPPTLNVEILLDRPSRPHKTIAILQDTHGGTPDDVNERLARKAREIGADAIVIFSITDRAVTDWWPDDPYYRAHGFSRPHYRPMRHIYRSTRARAIKYLR